MFTPHHMSYVRSQVSGGRCYVSCVRCHVSGVTCHLSFFSSSSFGQSGWASRWRVCYQRGLPRLWLGCYSVVYIGLFQGVIYSLQCKLSDKWQRHFSVKNDRRSQVARVLSIMVDQTMRKLRNLQNDSRLQTDLYSGCRTAKIA